MRPPREREARAGGRGLSTTAGIESRSSPHPPPTLTDPAPTARDPEPRLRRRGPGPASLAAGLAFAASGCTPLQPFAGPPIASTDGRPLLRSPGAGLVVDDRSPLPDAPVPLRFVLVPSRSHATPSAGSGLARDVTHVYQGRADYDLLSTFFTEQLDRHGWRPDPAGPGSGPIRAYLKGPEQLHLSLSEARGVATVAVRIAGRREAMAPG